jgi:hypothetical protein
MSRALIIAALVCLLAGPIGGGGEKTGHPMDKDHVMVLGDEVKWGPGPPGLPAGAQAALLTGDPGKAGGPYVLRVKLRDGYRVPPHWHPTDENVTVIKGTLMVGKGEKLDPSGMEALPAGSFMRMPKTMRHYAMAKGETILQVHGVGPFEINYVNPADDPRKQGGR